MNRDFKGVWIPKEIWLSEKLTLQEKVFLAEIESLDNKEGCFASNKYFADFFGLSKNRCSEVIKSLENKGLVSIRYIINENNKSIDKRIINVFDKSSTPTREVEGSIRKDDKGYSRKGEGNNTSTNNTTNNTSTIYTIFEYWNQLDIIKHREFTQNRKSRINARLKSYSVDELKQAIDNYKKVLDSDEYFFTHKWSLELFMQPKNLERFTDESKLDSFKKTASIKTTKEYIPMSDRYDPGKDEF